MTLFLLTMVSIVVSVVKWQHLILMTLLTHLHGKKNHWRKADIAIATAREFADNAEKLKVVP